MARSILSRVDEMRGRIEQLEGRLVQWQGQLRTLRGRARRARGAARVRLARLERRATAQVTRLQATARLSRDRVAGAVDTSRRRLEVMMRASEPGLRRVLEQAREVQAAAKRTRRGVRAGLRAGREAYRRSKPR
jgi:hypothetical protein